MTAGTDIKPKQFVSFDGSTKISSQEITPKSSDFFLHERLPFPAIARGAGLSYAAASFGEGVVSLDNSTLTNVLEFKQDEQWIEVQAGMSLGQLYNFLIDKNLFLATQPGHPRISLGGCIAPDIHGKNQFLDGTFINQICQIKLFHPEHGILELSPQNEPDLFRLSCGGYGLTGIILSCKLKLKKIPSSLAEVRLHPISRLEELPARLRESAARSDFILSWHDFTLKGNDFGKGFIQEGQFIAAEPDSKSKSKIAAEQSLDSASRGNFIVPVFNPLSIKLMNMLYGGRCRNGGSKFTMSLFESIFPIQNSKELYFKFFGRPGFHEYQVVVPEENFMQYMDGIKSYLSKHPLPITLASSKLFAGQSDLLRFSGNGICFALNFQRNRESVNFLNYLDKILLECRAIPNIIKDSRLSPDIVAAAYPEYEKFRRQLNDFDPKRLFRSELSERLAL